MRFSRFSIIILATLFFSVQKTFAEESFFPQKTKNEYVLAKTTFQKATLKSTYDVTETQYFSMSNPNIEVVKTEGNKVTFTDKSPDSQFVYYLVDKLTYIELTGELVEGADGQLLIAVPHRYTSTLLQKGNDFLLTEVYPEGHKQELMNVGKEKVLVKYNSSGGLVQVQKDNQVNVLIQFDPKSYANAVENNLTWEPEFSKLEESNGTRLIRYQKNGVGFLKIMEEKSTGPMLREVSVKKSGGASDSFYYRGETTCLGINFPQVQEKEVLSVGGVPKFRRIVENIMVETVEDSVWDKRLSELSIKAQQAANDTK